MNFKIPFFIIFMATFTSCDPEPTGPESDCDLRPFYGLQYHGVDANKVFDVRPSTPLEIKNGTLEYDLFYQWAFLQDEDTIPYPYNEYFIDSITFKSESSVEVGFFDNDLSNTYDYIRNDCQIELSSAEGDLHLELIHKGDEIAEQRFAIWEHRMPRPNRDTFLFIEFRLDPFASYEEIAKQFALDNPGLYDTIAIERVQNRTKE